MFDQSFTNRTVLRELRKSDFINSPMLRNELFKASVVGDAVSFSKTSHFVEDDFDVKTVKGKPVYSLKALHKELVQRKANNNLKRHYRLKQKDRSVIVNQLISILKEQLPYHVYRLDIHKFYESIDVDSLVESIESDSFINYRTKVFVANFLRSFQSGNRSGLPRGISMSATLSELIMCTFDEAVARKSDVFYYARFVDDIVIVTSTKESSSFVNEIEENLPKGLRFNNVSDGAEKRSKISTKKPVKKDQSFTYLGYDILIKKGESNTVKRDRDILLDISNSKKKKIKTRLIKSFVYYEKKGDFKLLLDRVALLTSNFSLLDKKKEIHVMSGIFYNYPCVDAENSRALNELDVLLRNIIIRNRSITSSSPLGLTKGQQKSLLKYSFTKGFQNRYKVYFSPTRQQKLQSTWKDER